MKRDNSYTWHSVCPDKEITKSKTFVIHNYLHCKTRPATASLACIRVVKSEPA